MLQTGDVTVAFVPRETISQTLGCLDRLIALTPPPYDLIVVVAGYPAEIVDAIRGRVEVAGGQLVEFSHYVTPNEARNAALAKTTSRYIAFVDHDVHVAENWLAPLVDCAVQTGAAIVSPLIFERTPLFTYLHMVGGEAAVDKLPSGLNAYRDIHYHAHKSHSEIGEPVKRHPTGLAEFHTVLVDTAWLASVGRLDPKLLSVSEHWDMCVTATRTGRSIYVEPESRVTYVPVTQLTQEDARWFALRWSEAWANDSLSYLAAKYGISPDDASFNGLRGFLRRHRGYRYIPIEKKISKFFGKRAGRFLTKHIIKPVVELKQNAQLKRDLALWRMNYDETRLAGDFGNQP